jgi:hypothetical protein
VVVPNQNGQQLEPMGQQGANYNKSKGGADWYMWYVLKTLTLSHTYDPFGPADNIPNAAENECQHGNLPTDRVTRCDCWKKM